MRKPKLYRSRRPINGVTVVLTPEAHAAFEQIASHFTRHGNYDTMDATLWTTVAHGTFTFVLDSRYFGSEFCRKVRTAGYGLLDEAEKYFDVFPFQTEHTFSLPFASGDTENFEEEVKKGWGPKTQLFVDMIHEAKDAQSKILAAA